MTGFKDFVNAKPVQGVYAACSYCDDTKSLLDEYCKQHNIPNVVDKDSYHSTIVYSKAPLDKKLHINLNEVPWQFHPLELKEVSSQEGKKVLVLEIHAPELHELHQNLLARGAIHSFPNYLAHITLSYDMGNFMFNQLPLPTFPLNVESIYSEPLED